MVDYKKPSSDKSTNSPTKKTSNFKTLRSELDSETYKLWDREQKYIRRMIKEKDDFDWSLDRAGSLKYIGGVDLSFSKISNDVAVSYLVVLSYPELQIVYEDFEVVELDTKYIPGFLAFREAAHLVKLVDNLKKKDPSKLPQVIMVDGNGIWHQNACGLASHLGVLIDIPTIGCGKTVFYVDGLHEQLVYDLSERYNQKGGDYYKLYGKSGRYWGSALKPTDKSEEPLIVSVGHKISLDTASKLVSKCCKSHIPEPVRLADARSRAIAKNKFKMENAKPVKNKMIFIAPPEDATKTEKATDKPIMKTMPLSK